MQEELVEVKEIVKEANEVAKEAKAAATSIGESINEVWNAIGKQAKELDEVKAIKTSTAWTQVAMRFSPTTPKQEDGEKSRTITFGNWPEGTTSQTIIDFIAKHMEEAREDIEDDKGIFAYGKNYAVRGAARFKTTALLLKYLRKDDTKTKIVKEHLVIYIIRDADKPQDDIDREKAVRKLVRAIIEKEETAQEPVDAETTRKNIEAKYELGIVFYYKGVRVGAYKNNKMRLLGEAVQLQTKYDQLMSS